MNSRSLPLWRQILNDMCKKRGTRTVAAELGYGRSSVCLAKNGKYPGGTSKIEARVLEVYSGDDGVFFCPAMDKTVLPDECREFAARPMPTSSPFAMRKWRKCQECHHRKSLKGENNA